MKRPKTKKVKKKRCNAKDAYYSEALKVLKTDMDKEARGALLRSIFCVASNHVVNSLKRAVVAKCLQEIMQYAPLPAVLPFVETLLRHPIQPTFMQQRASQFVQVFVQNVPRFCVESSGCDLFRLQAVYDKLFAYAIRNFETAIRDRYTSFIVRAILSALGGLTKISPTDDGDPKYPPLPENWNVTEKLRVFSHKVKDLNFEEAISDSVVCPVITAFLYASSKLVPSLIVEVAASFENIIYTQEKFDPLVCDKSSSFFLQCLVECDRKIREHVLHEFSTRFMNSHDMDVTNYVLHSAVSSISSAKEMATVGPELIDFKVLFTCFRLHAPKVIVEITKMCVKYAFDIETLIENLIMLFYCDEPEERRKDFLRCLFAWRVYDSLKNKFDSINLTGALVAEELFRSPTYSEALKESLLNFSGPELLWISCNASGSFAMQALFSGMLFSKKKVLCDFTDKMMPHVVQLATDKRGSYVLTKLWDASELRYRISIAHELCNNEKKVLSQPSGKFLSDRFQLKDFKNKHHQWTTDQCSHIKKQIMLGELTLKDSDEQLKNKNDNNKTAESKQANEETTDDISKKPLQKGGKRKCGKKQDMVRLDPADLTLTDKKPTKRKRK